MAIAAAAALMFALAIASAHQTRVRADGPSETTIVQRHGDTTWTLNVVFSPAFGGDASQVTSEVARKFGLAAAPDLTTSYAATSWPWPASRMPVAVWYNGGSDPVQVNPISRVPEPVSLVGSLQRTIDTWNAAPRQSFRFRFAGATTAGTGACNQTADGLNVVRFATDLPAGVLAITCSMSASGSVGGDPIEFDMEVSTSACTWSVALPTPVAACDLDSTILHELGHALGLQHSLDPSAVMYARLALGASRRTLSPDDIAGIQKLYGNAGAAPPAAYQPAANSTLPATSDAPAGASTPASVKSAAISVTPNGSYTPGTNSVVVAGQGSAAAVAAEVGSSSRLAVQAIWALAGGRWQYFLPSAPNIDGGLKAFQGPVMSAMVVLQ